MSSAIQTNLVEKNKEYAEHFDQSHLALPPAKKYAVGKSLKLAYQHSIVASASINARSCTDNRFYTAKRKAQAHHGPPTVTCMDARIDPCSAYGISLGDAHVIRNAGGSAKEALRSLVISEQLLGTREILLVKHTGCGMLTFNKQDATAVVQKNLGEGAGKELEGLNFLPIPRLEKAVEEDVQFLKSSKAIPEGVDISGRVYEVETGKVRQVT